MNPKCQTRPGFDTFSAKSADLTGLKMRRITRAVSFDHLVGAQQGRSWHRQAERVCGLEIHYKPEFGRCLHGKVVWLLSAKDAIDIRRRTPEQVGEIDAVGDQAATSGLIRIRIDSRQ